MSRPQGSAAQIAGSGAMLSLLPDVAGSYAVSLVVSDTCGASAPLQLTVSAIEVAPVANAGPALVAYATPAGQILVDGSASSDATVTLSRSGAQWAGPFLSQDGTRLFSGAGQIWRASDLTAQGTLLAVGETTTFTWIADSTAADAILAVKGGVYGDDAFRRYGRTSLALIEKKFFPAVVANKQATTGTAQWACRKADGSGYYVVFVTSGLTGVAAY